MAKNIYSVAHKAYLVFNPGLGKAVEAEIRQILANLFLKTKYEAQIQHSKNTELEISNISLYSLVEILLRSQTLQDLRLFIAREEIVLESQFRKFCTQVDWETYIPKDASVGIRVQSTDSRLYHESMLRDILADKLSKNLNVKLIKGDEDEEPLTNLYIDFQNNKCSVSISLAGDSLFKRGFRELKSAVAPLREDIANACLRMALEFYRKHKKDFTPQNLWVPFGGTGTFTWEFLAYELNIAPALFGRNYALQQMSFFNEKNFKFILNKATADVKTKNLKKIQYTDFSAEACEAYRTNFTRFKEQLAKVSDLSFLEPISENSLEANFFESPYPEFEGNIFIPINPPYGLRLHANAQMTPFYAKIARKLLSFKEQKQNTLGGFILCPSETTWSAFTKEMSSLAKVETVHITQGGLDIRVCFFLL